MKKCCLLGVMDSFCFQSLPILRAFCLFAALGVFFLFLFSVTYFVG